MDAASCGPSNAIQNLNKHTQRDTSLQHQRFQQGNGPSSVQQFRQGKQHIDQRLNNEFQQFNSGNDFASSFMNQMNMKPNVQHHHPAQQQQQFQQNGAWVNDFSNLSIQQKPQTKSDWHQQFMQQSQSVAHQPQAQQPGFQQQMTPNYAMGNSYQMRTNVMPVAPVYQNQTEHQQAHKLEEEQRQFENEFDLVEKHLAEQQQQQAQEGVVADADINDIAKEKFAETARKVEDTIKSKNYDDSEMQKKFENSQFLKLMSSIGNRKVELEGDKLVTSDSKEDIREKGIPETESQTSFAAHQEQQQQQQQATSNNPDYHQPMFDRSPQPVPAPLRTGVNAPTENVQEAAPQQEDPHENKLPDPLAHILDGQLSDINDPLTAAKVISGGQVQTHDWMEDFDDEPSTRTHPETVERPFRKGQIVDHHWDEMYHDYRHDDDYY
ncbi:hypothetical protein Cantr_06886 [Candida viswanathii]|uniref:Uncharacterized protein n=1 Tax=Candida viswanathii TaxID=5486 RepID=A0A367XYQ5_9ASCO|nr:hypothetical protein Cantr_06886 [Candida viswanathii]